MEGAEILRRSRNILSNQEYREEIGINVGNMNTKKK